MALHRAVTAYQSVTGKQHNTPEAAAQGTRDHLCELLANALQPLFSAGKITASERYQIVNTLAGSDAAIAKLVLEVRPVLNWINENAEDQDDDN